MLRGKRDGFQDQVFSPKSSTKAVTAGLPQKQPLPAFLVHLQFLPLIKRMEGREVASLPGITLSPVLVPNFLLCNMGQVFLSV